jgi:CheY-like chemotaxis protein
MKQGKVVGKRILLVDEDFEFKRAMNEGAAGRGVALDSVGSRDLMKKLGSLHYYDLVVLDYDLDALTGLEIAEFLQKHMPHKPLVMLTASGRPWQTEGENTPNVRAVKSKWDGIDDILDEAIAQAT